MVAIAKVLQGVAKAGFAYGGNYLRVGLADQDYPQRFAECLIGEILGRQYFP